MKTLLKVHTPQHLGNHNVAQVCWNTCYEKNDKGKEKKKMDEKREGIEQTNRSAGSEKEKELYHEITVEIY